MESASDRRIRLARERLQRYRRRLDNAEYRRQQDVQRARLVRERETPARRSERLANNRQRRRDLRAEETSQQRYTAPDLL